MIPQLNEEDIGKFDSVLKELLEKSEADVALIVERAGYLIHQRGQLEGFEPAQVATLASNAFAASEFMANIIKEPDFTGMYQQGSTISTLTLNIDQSCLLFLAFRAAHSVGAIKYFAAQAVLKLAEQLDHAHKRAPEKAFDLADLNPTNVQELFKRDGSN
jgi:predicted regulator of Ras-like GTPase activity (Roadblock/LC7/MglB family)